MAFDIGAVSEPLDERTAGDLLADAIAALQVAMPDWVPRNGSPEVIYLEAVALAAAEVVNAGNAIIAAVVEAVLETLFLVPRGTGVQAVGELTITFDSTVTTTVYAGTRFSLPEYGTELLVTADATVTAGTTLVVQVVTADATSAVNGVGSAAAVDILDSIPNALSVAISSDMANGAEPEDDTAYIARSRNVLGLVSNSLVVLDHYTSYCRLSGLVSNATTIGAWDGAAIGTAGSDAGYVTSVVYGSGGTVSAENKATLAADMQAITADGVTVAVVDADLEVVNVEVDVVAISGVETATVQASVQAAITAWLRPETWEFGETVRTTSLTALVAGVDGVDYVDSLTAPATDVTLTANQLADLGTLTVSVA